VVLALLALIAGERGERGDHYLGGLVPVDSTPAPPSVSRAVTEVYPRETDTPGTIRIG
jgi:hypothetical protein